MKKPSRNTVWLIILTIVVIMQLPLSFFSVLSVVGTNIVYDKVDELELRFDEKAGLDMVYVNTVAKIIFSQSVKNCQLEYKIDLLNGSNTAFEDYDDCSWVGILGLKALEEIKDEFDKKMDGL